MRFLLLFCVFLSLLNAEKLEWDNLSDEQIYNATKIYEIAKEHNLAETMIAIAWQESRLGKIPINLEDKASCGVHHVHIKTFLWQNKIQDNLYNRNLYCSKLIQDIELSTENAIKFFKYAKKKNKGDHKKAIMSYNAGFDLQKTKTVAIKYYNSVKEYMEDAKEIIAIIDTINFINEDIELAWVE